VTGIHGRSGRANGRGVAARVRGSVAVASAGAGYSGLPAQGREQTGATGGGQVGLGRASGPAAKPSKYGNTKVIYEGMKFDSRRELTRWLHLVALQKAGELSELERQVVFVLAPAVVIQGKRRPALRYVADFVYTDAGGNTVTEDVK